MASPRVPAWLPYTVLRIVFVAVPAVGAYVLGANIVLAVILGSIVGLCLSVIFLRKQRSELSVSIDRVRRTRPAKPTDEDLEDSTVERVAPEPDQNASTAARLKP